MPSYIVKIHRSTTEVAEFNVDADNREDAEEIAYRLGEESTSGWHTDGWQYDFQETTVDKALEPGQ